MAAPPKIRVVSVLDLIDLRRVIAKRSFLKSVAAEHNLGNYEAVGYTNRAHSRWRLVLRFGPLLVMCQCEVEDETKFATYLRITEGLGTMAGEVPLIEITRLADYTKERMRRDKKRKRK